MKQWLQYFSKLIFRNGMRLVLGWMILFSAGCAGAPVTEVVEIPIPSVSPENPTGTVPVARRDYREKTYCTIDNVDLLYDLSYPNDGSAEPLPMVVYVHGGAWKMGDRRGGAGVEFKTALLEAGYVYAAIDYRLAPDYLFPAQIEDVKCAIRYFRANAETLGIDPDRIAVMGGSAGGHLVSLLGLTAGQNIWEDAGGFQGVSSAVAGVVDLFGPTDLRPISDARYRGNYEEIFGEAVFSQEMMWAFSPLAYVGEEAPPFLILHGDADEIVMLYHSVDLQAALLDAGVPAELVIVSGGGHSNALFTEGASPDLGELTAILVEFLGENLEVD
jgi:acetyl esterase/lipase